VDQDCIKLTTFIRGHLTKVMATGGALANLYDVGQIPASVLLRGANGTGLRQHFHSGSMPGSSDDVLTVAETVAIGRRPEIERELDQRVTKLGSGLLTLRQARLLSEEIDPVALRDGADEATKLTIYFSRQDVVFQVPAFEVICEVLHRRGMAGATALSGIDGTIGGLVQRQRSYSRNGAAPMMVIAIGSGAHLGLIIPELGGLLRHPVMTLEQIRICKQDGRLLSLPETRPGTDAHGRPLWQKLAVYACESAHPEGQALHRTMVRRLHDAGISGTTLRGRWGFHAEHVPHGGRHVPAITIVIDAPERISTAFTIIDELTGTRGLVTSETVTAVRAG